MSENPSEENQDQIPDIQEFVTNLKQIITPDSEQKSIIEQVFDIQHLIEKNKEENKVNESVYEIKPDFSFSYEKQVQRLKEFLFFSIENFGIEDENETLKKDIENIFSSVDKLNLFEFKKQMDEFLQHLQQ